MHRAVTSYLGQANYDDDPEKAHQQRSTREYACVRHSALTSHVINHIRRVPVYLLYGSASQSES